MRRQKDIAASVCVVDVPTTFPKGLDLADPTLHHFYIFALALRRARRRSDIVSRIVRLGDYCAAEIGRAFPSASRDSMSTYVESSASGPTQTNAIYLILIINI